jgi:hypothetical protein
MRTKKSIYLASALFVIGALTFVSCNKDEEKTTPDVQISATDTENALISESHDAIAENLENDIDNNLDKLEVNGYSSTSLKSGEVSCVSVKIDSTGTNVFPRTITLTYNCTDTINNEKISKTGEVKIEVDRIRTDSTKYFKRRITFIDFKIATDSSSVTVNGNRTLTRLKVKTSYTDMMKKCAFSITDSITSDLTFVVEYKDTTVTFTRIASKVRTITKNYIKETGHWKSDFTNDSITYTGQISGKDAKGNSYLRKYINPVKITRCLSGQLVVSSGSIELSKNDTVVGTITYEKEGCSNNIKLSKEGRSKNIERKMAKRLRKA